MKYVVTSRELKWQGKLLRRGEGFEALTDRDIKHAGTLKLIGRAADAAPEPARHAATVKALEPAEVVAEVAAEPEPAPEVAEPETTPEAPEPEPAHTPTYKTRRLKARD